MLSKPHNTSGMAIVRLMTSSLLALCLSGLSSVAQPFPGIEIGKVEPVRFSDWTPVQGPRKDLPYQPKFDDSQAFSGLEITIDGQVERDGLGQTELTEPALIKAVNAVAHISFNSLWDIAVMPGAEFEISADGIIVHEGHIVVRGTMIETDSDNTILVKSADGMAAISANQFELFSFAHFDWEPNGYVSWMQRIYLPGENRRLADLTFQGEPVDLGATESFSVCQTTQVEHKISTVSIARRCRRWQDYPQLANKVLPSGRFIAPVFAYMAEGLFFPYEAEQMKAILEDAGLKVVSGKPSYSVDEWRVGRVVRFSPLPTSDTVELRTIELGSQIPRLGILQQQRNTREAFKLLEDAGVVPNLVWHRETPRLDNRSKSWIAKLWIGDGEPAETSIGGQLVPAGSTVNIGLYHPSWGHLAPQVNVVGMDAARAEATLRAAGISRHQVLETVVLGINRSRVTSQLPRPGALIRKSEPYYPTLEVEVPGVQMPDLTGLTAERAVERVEALNIRARISERSYESGTHGTVRGTYPETGSVVKVGETVTIYVRKNPSGSPSAPTPEPEPQSNSASAGVSFYFWDGVTWGRIDKPSINRLWAMVPEEKAGMATPSNLHPTELVDLRLADDGAIYWSGTTLDKLLPVTPYHYKGERHEIFFTPNGVGIKLGQGWVLRSARDYERQRFYDVEYESFADQSDNFSLTWRWPAGTQSGKAQMFVNKNGSRTLIGSYNLSVDDTNRGKIGHLFLLRNEDADLFYEIIPIMPDGTEGEPIEGRAELLAWDKSLTRWNDLQNSAANRITPVYVNRSWLAAVHASQTYKENPSYQDDDAGRPTNCIKLPLANGRETSQDRCPVFRYRNTTFGVVGPETGNSPDRLLAISDSGESYFVYLERPALIPTHFEVLDNGDLKIHGWNAEQVKKGETPDLISHYVRANWLQEPESGPLFVKPSGELPQ